MGSVERISPKTTRAHPTYQSRVEWLPVAKLEVDSALRAQRPYDDKWARRLASEFDPDLLGLILVVAIPMPGGGERLLIADGQHRAAATELALGQGQSIQCEVVRGLDVAQAAKLFRGRNTQRQVRQIDMFIAGVTAGEVEEVAIDGIVRSLGLRIASGSKIGYIAAVSSLRSIYRMGPPEGHGRLLRQVLRLAIAAWGKEALALNGDVLRGLALVMHRHQDDYDAEVFERKLRGYTGGPGGLLSNARSFRNGLGGGIASCVARVAVVAYNSGRTKHQLPNWGDKAS